MVENQSLLLKSPARDQERMATPMKVLNKIKPDNTRAARYETSSFHMVITRDAQRSSANVKQQHLVVHCPEPIRVEDRRANMKVSKPRALLYKRLTPLYSSVTCISGKTQRLLSQLFGFFYGGKSRSPNFILLIL